MTQLSYCTYHTRVCTTTHRGTHTPQREHRVSITSLQVYQPLTTSHTRGATLPVPIAATITVPAAVADFLVSSSVNISDLSATEWS